MEGILDVEILANVTNFEIMCRMLEKSVKKGIRGTAPGRAALRTAQRPPRASRSPPSSPAPPRVDLPPYDAHLFSVYDD